LKYLTDVTAYMDMGWAHLLLGQYDKSRETYNHMIEQSAFEFAAFYFLGVIDELEGHPGKAAGRFESAIAICRKQLASDPDNTYCRMILAQAQARLGNKDEALENAAKAAAAETGNGGITVELARTRALCGDASGAVVALASALNQPMGPSVFEIKADPHFAGIDLSQLPADK